MGCNCKGKTTTTGKSFINDENASMIIKSKLFFYFMFIISAPILFPLMLVLSLINIITGNPIDVIKVVTFLVPKKKKFVPDEGK